MFEVVHHGAVDGVTGSCHELRLASGDSVLVDCGLFQGAESLDRETGNEDFNRKQIDFPLDGVRALVVTHCHIDHVGRIPFLLAAGFDGPIYATEATAHLLPLVIEDAIKVGISRDERLIRSVLAKLRSLLVAVPYKQWFAVAGVAGLRGKFQCAGHILGSAYVEFDVALAKPSQRVVFSGDLGAPYSPLLPAPKAPYRADTLVIESTYGDRVHESRRQRRAQLQRVIEACFENGGSVLIPAFSIGRTQELLYELEEIIHRVERDLARKAGRGVGLPAQSQAWPAPTEGGSGFVGGGHTPDSPIGAGDGFVGGGHAPDNPTVADVGFVGGGHAPDSSIGAGDGFVGGGHAPDSPIGADVGFVGGGHAPDSPIGADVGFVGGGHAPDSPIGAGDGFVGGGHAPDSSIGAGDGFVGGGHAPDRVSNNVWEHLDIIVDSPLAAEFTASYRALKHLWDAEARRKVKGGRHPLAFDQVLTINSHADHLQTVEYLRKTGRPAIVIAASGMCAGGRIQNYLKALLPDERTDVLFVGFQARGTPGRDIQTYGPRFSQGRSPGYVVLDGERVDIKAGVYTLGGYSAHADQKDLLNFVKRMRHKPKHIRIVHGDDAAKRELQRLYRELLPEAEVVIG